MADILTCQFVDAPSATAALRYDFFVKNAAYKAHILNEGGFDLGIPAWTGDPEGVGGQYGYRQMRFTQRIEGTKAVAMARLSLLAKEMQRPTNWLKVQFATSLTPVYFKTYRGDPGTLSLEYVEPSQAWDITVPLVADPFAYGARVTMSTITLTQTPVGNGWQSILPALKGDAPTPLRVKLTPSTAGSGNNVAGSSGIYSSWLIGCIGIENANVSASTPVLDIGSVSDNVTNVSGTGAVVSDATYFGGGYRTVTIGATTPNTLTTRFSMLIATGLSIFPGRYKALLRCKYTAGAAQTLLFRLQQWANGNSAIASKGKITSVDVLAADTGRVFWVDLGDINYPFGIAPPVGAGGTVPANATLAVDIGTASGGASSVNVDSLVLLPVDGPAPIHPTFMYVSGPVGGAASSTVTGTFDGDLETYWGQTASSGAYLETTPTIKGVSLVADPGVEGNGVNLLIVMATDSGGGSASGTNYITALNAQTAVDVSYYPRYLYIGDGT